MFVRQNYWLCALSTVFIATSPARSQSVNTDPSTGRELSVSLCSTCHNVDASPGNIAKSDISSFYFIANRPEQTQERLAGAIILERITVLPNSPYL